MIMRNLIWGVGTQFRSSGGATNSLNCRPITLVLSFSFEILIFLCNTILSLAMLLEFVLSFRLACIILIWCIFVTMFYLYFKILNISTYIFCSCAFPSESHPRYFPNSLLTQLYVLSLLSQKEKNLFTSTPLKISIIWY